MWWILRQRAVLTVLLALAGCDSEPAPKKYTLLEVIHLTGSCHEDHANTGGDYSGYVVRYRVEDNGEISTYGSVTASDPVTNAIRAAKDPTKYQPPFMVTFDDIRVDTRQPRWTLHGVSDSRGDIDSGYASTCELDVQDRGTELPPILNSAPKASQ